MTGFAEGVVTEVIRPAAVLREDLARTVLVELAFRDVRAGGCWESNPTLWRRYDRPWDGPEGPDGHGSAGLVGSIQVAYGVPTRYDITLFRATITWFGGEQGWTVESLCDEALGFVGLDLASCPRADLVPPPPPSPWAYVRR
ncbi:MAG: hypothetical protein ACTHOD_22400 [Motilibacteraceae bacterium]